jgi:hypothetical protein
MSTPHQDRAIVLSRLRVALGVADADADGVREAAVEDRLRRDPRGTIPARALQSPEACIELLEAMLVRHGADVTRVAAPEDAGAGHWSFAWRSDHKNPYPGGCFGPTGGHPADAWHRPVLADRMPSLFRRSRI